MLYNVSKQSKEDVFMQIHESAENYLEAIYILTSTNEPVRSIDIVRYMNFSKPTVSIAMRNFHDEGFISIDESGYITLTEKGYKIAKRIYDRHQLLTDALMALGVSRENAEADACKIEHDISEETMLCIQKHMQMHQKKVSPKKELGVELL